MNREEFVEKMTAYVNAQCELVGLTDEKAKKAFEATVYKSIVHFYIKDEQRENIAKLLGL